MYSPITHPNKISDFDLPEIACWYEQGEELAQEKRYSEALSCFDQVVSLQPDCDAAWVFRAVMLLHLGEPQAALASCERAIQICPSNQEAWLFQGAALQRLGQYQKAYNSYDRALGHSNQSLGSRLLRWLRRT